MRRAAFLITIIFSLTFLYTCSELSDWFVTDEDEVNMGTDFYNQILADADEYPVLDTVGNEKNRLLYDYIDSIGHWIADHQTVRPENEYLKYDFTVIDKDTVVNAFAIPGGYVFIYTGLIKAAANEAEIAGVLAHEITHIAKRHGVDRLVKLMGVEYVKQLIFGDNSSLIADAVTALVFLKFSRDHEYEADSNAIEFLITSGYNPNGMKTFLQLLADNSGWNFEPASTHPDPKKRVEAAQRIIASKPTSVNSLPTPAKKYSPKE